MAVLSQLALILREICACSVDRAFCLAQAQKRRRVRLVHRLGELIRLRLAVQCFLGEHEQRLVSEHCEVVIHYLTNKTDLHASPHVILRQILLEGLGAEAALPAEKIEFVAGEADSGCVVAEGFSATSDGRLRIAARAAQRDGSVGWQLLDESRAACGNGWKEIAALDAK